MKFLKWQIVDAEIYEIQHCIRKKQKELLKGYEEENRLLKEQICLLKEVLQLKTKEEGDENNG